MLTCGFRYYIILLLAVFAALPANGATTSFTYQGKLSDSTGQLVNGTADLIFKLFGAEMAGNQVGSTITLAGTPVNAGLFTVLLDFGAGSFSSGEDRWLEVTANGQVLAPRTQITTAPFAVYAQSVPWSGVTGAPTSLPPSGDASGDLTGTYPGPTVGPDKITSGKIASDAESLARVSGGVMRSGKGGISIGSGPILGDPFSVYASRFILDQEHYDFNDVIYSSLTVWQSFTAGVDGSLAAVEFFIGCVHDDWSGTLSIYSGEGISGTLLTTQEISAYDFTLHKFVLDNMISISSGSKYTIAITPLNNEELSVFVDDRDTYSVGRFMNSQYPEDDRYDAWFYTYILEQSVNPVLVVESGKLNVGIGTAQPLAKLDVDGLIRSSKGYLFPGGRVQSTIGVTSSGTNNYIPRLSGDIVLKNSVIYQSDAGNIGIGTTSPGFPLTFANTGGDIISLYGNSGDHYGFGIQTALLQIHSENSGTDIAFGYGRSAAFTEAMRIKGSGKVGIGTSSPEEMLSIKGTLKVGQGNLNGNTLGEGAIKFGGGNTGEGITSNRAVSTVGENQWGLDFYTHSSRRMSITLDGNIGINTPNPQYKLHVNGSVAGVGAYNQLSDGRFKTNINEIANALDKVESLRGVTFDWKKTENPEICFDDSRQIGLIAQEVEKIVPEAVSKSGDGTYSVSYSSLVPVLIEAIKEQQKQMDEMKKQIEELRSKQAQ